jgi:hypothetical protein
MRAIVKQYEAGNEPVFRREFDLSPGECLAVFAAAEGQNVRRRLAFSPI